MRENRGSEEQERKVGCSEKQSEKVRSSQETNIVRSSYELSGAGEIIVDQ